MSDNEKQVAEQFGSPKATGWVFTFQLPGKFNTEDKRKHLSGIFDEAFWNSLPEFHANSFLAEKTLESPWINGWHDVKIRINVSDREKAYKVAKRVLNTVMRENGIDLVFR